MWRLFSIVSSNARMGIDAVLRRRENPGTGPARESLHVVAVVYGNNAVNDLIERVHGRMPMLSRLDPVSSVVLTRSDMPELLGELDQALTQAHSTDERQYLAATRALAEVCACDRALELHFDGD